MISFITIGALICILHQLKPFLKLLPGSLDGKEPACNVGDLGLISGLERFPGEVIGYPFQYSWASLVAHLVKNPLAMQETWIRSVGWEDPLEKG